jgi:hypothetical protein
MGYKPQTPAWMFDEMKKMVSSLPYRVVGLIPHPGLYFTQGQAAKLRENALDVFSDQLTIYSVIWQLQPAKAPAR